MVCAEREQKVPRRKEDMGEVGITLPFLVGALSLRTGRTSLAKEDVFALLQEILYGKLFICSPF